MEFTYEEFINNILETRGRFACGDEYHERHHIVPKCMGGTNNEKNLIDLFAREHFEAHRLLALENPDNKKLTHAWWMMSTRLSSSELEEKITAEEYEESRKAFSQMMSGENNPMYGKPSPMLGTHLTDEQKQHLRELNLGERSPKYGVHLSEETKEKIRLSHIGKIPTEEARLNMRNAHLGKNMGKDHANAKQIAQYDLDGNFIKVWPCIVDVAREYNIRGSAISQACKENRSAVGYQFRYVEGEIVNKIPPYVNQCGKYQVKTIAQCDENWNVINIWEGCTAASLATGINRAHIGSCCTGKRKTAGGYKWKVLNKDDE